MVTYFSDLSCVSPLLLSFFKLKLANHTGYIKVDWKRVERDMKKAKEQLKVRKGSQTPAEVKSKADEVRLVLFLCSV